MSPSFSHIPSSSQTKQNTCIAHSKGMEKSTIKAATLQLPSCNISFPNFIVSSSFAHTPSSSQSKRTHALRIQNTWELIITVATLLLPSCNKFISEFFVSSSLHTPSAHLRPKTTCIGHSNTWKLRLPHYYSRRGTFNFGTSLCPLHLHTSPSSSQIEKPDALHVQNAWQPTITVATLILPLCNISFQNFISPSSFAHIPSLVLHQNNTCTAHSKHMETTYHHGCHIATATPRSCSCTHRPFRFHPATECIARSSEALRVAQSVGSEGGGQN